MTEKVDIAIVGGGIVGASLAHALAGRRSVVVLEQESALGYHATGRSAAEFTFRFHSPLVGQLTAASRGFMRTPPDGFSDVALLKPRGNLLIANAEKAQRLAQVLAEEQARSPVADASPVEPLGVQQALEKVPFLNPEYLEAAFFDPDCWDVEVESLLQAYAKSARATGAEFRRGEQLLGGVREGDSWLLRTTQGELLAKTVVNAAGAWADSVAQLLGLKPLNIQPMRRTAITLKVPGYDVSTMPEVNEIDEDFYFKPDAGHLMVSPADETPVDPHDAWPEDMDIAIAADYMTQCTTLEITHVAHSWAGLRTFAPDRIPVVGSSAQQAGYFWLAGVGGYGIQTSPAVGQLAAALLCGDLGSLPVDLAGLAGALDPLRFESKL
ncbi:MAG: NAD(P)/FAD-dependent oxidoreductase [Granulosicoccaceae bacterium]